MTQVYLDNNATTAVDAEVLEKMNAFFSQDFGNASSIHQFGQRARSAVDEARDRVARLLGARPEEIAFTSGGTEADNAALWGVVAANPAAAGKGHIVTTRIEHPAILRMSEILEARGIRVTYVDVDQSGVVDVEAVKKALTNDTLLISVMFANNETGAVQPVQEISRLARSREILFHTDAVQGLGKARVSVEALGVDLLSLSAHKFHGPKGAGALYIRNGVPFHPFMVGGSHERKRRAGTENVPGIVGLGYACQRARIELEHFSGRVGSLRDRLEQGIMQSISGVRVNGDPGLRLPHVTNLSFEGVDGEALLVALDFQGIAVSTGAACASGSISGSHVLKAMGLPQERINSAIRFSLSRLTTEEEVNYVLGVLPQTVKRMREVSPAASFNVQ